MINFDYDDDFVFQPISGEVDVRAIEQHLATVPGAFRDPHRSTVWVMPTIAYQSEAMQERRAANPRSDRLEAWVAVTPDQVVVGNVGTGRARKLIAWLLEQDAYTLVARGERAADVRSTDDIYGDEPWDDPDDSPDPTEYPPLIGTLLSLERYFPDGHVEWLQIHSTGVLSFDHRRPGEPQAKTYRRLAPAEQAIVAGFGEKIAHGPDVWWADTAQPIMVRIDGPTDSLGSGRFDMARLPAACRAELELLDGWARALRADRAAMPPGLLPYDQAAS